MRIFADTNVLVSAFSVKGLCADLLEVILADHHLMTGEIVLEELQLVLTEKLKVPVSNVSDVTKFLRNHLVEPVPDEPSEANVWYADDRWVLESAIRFKADIFVTGDRDLLEISKNISQLKVISPRGLWELLQK